MKLDKGKTVQPLLSHSQNSDNCGSQINTYLDKYRWDTSCLWRKHNLVNISQNQIQKSRSTLNLQQMQYLTYLHRSSQSGFAGNCHPEEDQSCLRQRRSLFWDHFYTQPHQAVLDWAAFLHNLSLQRHQPARNHEESRFPSTGTSFLVDFI